MWNVDVGNFLNRNHCTESWNTVWDSNKKCLNFKFQHKMSMDFNECDHYQKTTGTKGYKIKNVKMNWQILL